MAKRASLENRVRELRDRNGWSQGDLAGRAGLSRAGVSAIETGRLVPSASAALSLAAALSCRVEDLFQLAGTTPRAEAWAWPPRGEPARFWRAEVGGRRWLYPVEATASGVLPHDGTARDGGLADAAGADPSRTLVVATCDPAVALLAGELMRSAGVRLIPLPRSSGDALALLGRGVVHAAGVHLEAGAIGGPGNAAAVRERLGDGYRLLRVARWEEGLTLAPSPRISTVRDALGAGLRWVGREAGSGARQCLDELLAGRAGKPPRRVARDHRGVAEAVRCGWADVGVCLRLAAEEADLSFLRVRVEAYDLAFPTSLEADPRLRALVAAVRSPSYRRALAALPGYDASEAGELLAAT